MEGSMRQHLSHDLPLALPNLLKQQDLEPRADGGEASDHKSLCDVLWQNLDVEKVALLLVHLNTGTQT